MDQLPLFYRWKNWGVNQACCLPQIKRWFAVRTITSWLAIRSQSILFQKFIHAIIKFVCLYAHTCVCTHTGTHVSNEMQLALSIDDSSTWRWCEYSAQRRQKVRELWFYPVVAPWPDLLPEQRGASLRRGKPKGIPHIILPIVFLFQSFKVFMFFLFFSSRWLSKVQVIA